MAVPFFTVTVLMAFNTYSTVNIEAKKKNDQLAERSQYVLDGIFDRATTLYNQISLDENVLYLLTADTLHSDVLTVKQSVTSFYNRARREVTTGTMLDSVFLYSEKNSYVHSIDSSNFLDRFLFLDWYHAYVKAGKENTICSSVINGKEVISVVMNITYEGNIEGALVFNILKSYVDTALGEPSEENFQYYSFLMGESGPVYSPEGVDFDKIKKEAFLTQSNDFHGYPLSYCGFFVCDIASLAMQRMLPVAFPYSVLLLFSVIFVAFMCSLKFYKSIANIMAVFENVASGTDMHSENYNELRYINDNIVNMLMHSKQVENDLVMRFSDLKKAQSIALQTQMNPHFLFNTLNLVNAIIIEDCGRDTDAVMVVKKLAELLNLSLDTKTYIVTVESELNYAKKYIDIELLRSDYNFIVDWDISPDILKCKTLKMILQPILENAIFHGINNIHDDRIGRILVHAYRKNNSLVFSIKDNGNGIDAKVLSKITKKLNSDGIIESKHIGIANVNSRIRIVYGSEYGISVKTSSLGTEIIIVQPLVD